jgi:hypothetical protein
MLGEVQTRSTLALVLAVPLLALTELSLAAGCGSDSLPAPLGTDASDAKAPRADASLADARGDAPPKGTDASSRDAGDGGARVDGCNGHTELCGRLYDQVAFPGTHGSYSVSSEGFMAPDQTYSIARQLADGIRVLHLEVHVYEGEVYACHSLCVLGKKLFVDEMKSVDAFLVANPGEVVTLLLERSDAVITADDIGSAMKTAGLASSTHVQALGAPWPTLGEMIQKGERLVALLDNPTGSSSAWLLPRWQLTWETPWDNEIPADFGRCNADRGMMGDGVYVVDTYLEDLAVESAAHAALVNYDPFLVTRLLYCKRATATLPNFVMVNFYEVSDIFSVVDVLNGFAPTPDVDLDAFPPSAWPSDGGVMEAGQDGAADSPSAVDAASDAGSDGRPSDSGLAPG